jgi:hypothetical protein
MSYFGRGFFGAGYYGQTFWGLSESGPPPEFPPQFFGLRAYFQDAIRDLCLVAEADAPAGMGGVLKILKGATKYAVYLVETSDPNASPIRVRTSTGVKAVRLKT